MNTSHSHPTYDSNENPLKDGDAVILIKDLTLKGTSRVVKRGTVVKKIRLTEDPAHIKGKVEGTTMFLKTEFLKKKK